MRDGRAAHDGGKGNGSTNFHALSSKTSRVIPYRKRRTLKRGALERLAIPVGEVGCGVVSALQEGEQGVVG